MQYQSKKITAVLCGYHRSGPILYAALKKIGLRPMIIDLDPEVETRLPSKKTPYLYGDLNNSEFIGEIPLKHCKILISTTKEVSSNSLLAELASSKYPDVITIFFAETDTDEQVLYQAGATYVMRPQLETAHQLDKFLQRVGVNKESFERKATSASY